VAGVRTVGTCKLPLWSLLSGGAIEGCDNIIVLAFIQGVCLGVSTQTDLVRPLSNWTTDQGLATMLLKEHNLLWSSILQMALGDGTPQKAIFTALFVGTLLTLINHGDLIFIGTMPPLWKVMLTYCVPYCVTTWGAITGKIAQRQRYEA